MLEPILKGLVEWLYQIMVDIMAYASGELIGVMSMDLSYFERTAPVISNIVSVFIALGWALLLGNLVFQLIKSMVSGLGFEAEDPKILFFRTFIFSFLLLSSKQICNIGLSITGTVIDLLAVPSQINIRTPDESMFSLGADAKWLLVIIVGVALMVQMIKLLFEIGERYVITSVLTFFAPLAFSMGGSRNTSDIFKGWVRMYCSMLIMMIMNIVFLKLIMSAMSRMTAGGVLVWLVFVVALTRVARKIDSHIGKIGLNPAQTGNAGGSRLPGMMTMMAVRVMTSTISKSLSGGGKGGSAGNSKATRQSSYGGRSDRSNHYTAGANTYNNKGNDSVSNNNESKSYMQTGRQSENSFNNGYSVSAAAGEKGRSDTAVRTSAPPLSRNTSKGSYGINETAVKSSAYSKDDRQNNVGQRINGKIGSVGERQNNKTAMNGTRNVSSNAESNIQNGGIKSHEYVSGTENKGYIVNGGAKSYNKNSKTVDSSVEHGKTVTSSQINRQETGKINASSGKVSGRTGSEVHMNNKVSSSGAFEHTENSRNEIENIHSTRSFYEYGKRTAEAEHKINHEYKHGRYNPAAKNKKAQTDFYKKDSIPNRKKEDKNGKHKR